MRPDVRAVVRDIDGQITHDANVFVAAVILERTPLIKKNELQKLLRADLLGKLFASTLDRGRIAANEVAVPLGPGDSTEFVFENAEERVVRQPRPFGFFELLELSFGVLWSRSSEMLKGQTEFLPLKFVYALIVNLVGGELGKIVDIASVEQAFID